MARELANELSRDELGGVREPVDDDGYIDEGPLEDPPVRDGACESTRSTVAARLLAAPRPARTHALAPWCPDTRDSRRVVVCGLRGPSVESRRCHTTACQTSRRSCRTTATRTRTTSSWLSVPRRGCPRARCRQIWRTGCRGRGATRWRTSRARQRTSRSPPCPPSARRTCSASSSTFRRGTRWRRRRGRRSGWKTRPSASPLRGRTGRQAGVNER